jgi:hypothetical protein
VSLAHTNTRSVKGEAAQFDQGQTLDEARIRHEISELHRQSVVDTELHGIRKDYTKRLFSLTCVWLITVQVFVFLSALRGIVLLPGLGLGNLPFAFSLNMAQECDVCAKFIFSLPERVLIAFITSTTATVVGIFLIVAKWLFPANAVREIKPQNLKKA